ncbi:MAG: pyruvate kinase [Synergistales bacterium]
MKRVKIVCTLGPACGSRETLAEMVKAGMNVARLNFSHGSYESHGETLGNIRAVEQRLGVPLATILDTKGPEIRTGRLLNGQPVTLVPGEKFRFIAEEGEGDERQVTISHPQICSELAPGQDVFIDDGTLQLKVLETGDKELLMEVLVGGELGEKKGVSFPGAKLKIPTLTEKDRMDIRWGLDNGLDYIAVSFVRCRDDIMEVRRVMEELGGSMKIIAKIETSEAVASLEEIVEVVDGLMVARGDLGVELPAEEVPLIQKRMVDLGRSQGKPVIVATQMLDSMIRNPRPTRAEVNDVANAVLDGADAVMLSGETAKGAYPVQAVETMARIVTRTEKEIRVWQRPSSRPFVASQTVPDAVSHAAVTIAEQMQAKVILSLTQSGSTARMVSKYRPDCPISGVTAERRTWRELALVWGVVPILTGKKHEDEREMVESGLLATLAEGMASEGDIVVVTSGLPTGIAGTTDMVKVHTVGRIVVKGISLVRKEAFGPVVKGATAAEARDKMRQGAVLVARQTDREFVDVIRQASAIICEEGGLTSHAAILALEMGIPCVVSATDAMKLLDDGMLVTVDGSRGLVYHGKVRVR